MNLLQRDMDGLIEHATIVFAQLVEAYEPVLNELCNDLDGAILPFVAHDVKFGIVIKNDGDGFRVEPKTERR